METVFGQRNANEIKKATCFVLMPFHEKYKEVYNVIKETLESESLNIECKRADDFHQPHIMETILNGIAKAEFIIADLTGANSNVFYELGLAHSFKNIKKVILITQDLKYVPFDLNQFRCIVYNQTISGSRALQNELIRTFNDISNDSFRIKITESVRVSLNKRLLGIENFLYELDFESHVIGHDSMKLIIHFTQLSVDGLRTNLTDQNLYLDEVKPEVEIENIPWNVSLGPIRGNQAIISIDKR